MSSNNFEHTFKDEFSDFRETPSSQTWDQLSAQLDEQDWNTQWANKFGQYQVKPSSGAWSKIASQLSPSSKKILNLPFAYVIAGSVATIAFIFLWWFNNLNTDPIKTELTQNTRQNNSSNIDKTPQIPENTPTNSTETSDLSTNSIRVDQDSSKKTHKKNISTNRNSQSNSHTPEQGPISYSNLGNPTSETPIDPPKVSIVDTIIVVDTIHHYDTLIVTVDQSNQTKKRHWSVSPKFSILTSQSDYKQSGERTVLLNNAHHSSMSYAAGIGINYDYKNFRLSSGVDYAQIAETFEYETNQYFVNSTERFNLFEKSRHQEINEHIDYEVHTHAICKIDTLEMHYTIEKVEHLNYTYLDTVWHFKVDTTISILSDSVRTIRIDTTDVVLFDTSYFRTIDTLSVRTNQYQNINKYSYLEIPFSIGYGINWEKWSLRPGIGGIVGVMLYAKGKGISMTDKNTVYEFTEKDLPFVNFQFSLLLSISLEYKIEEQFSMMAQALYRSNLNSMYQGSYAEQKYMSGFGLNLGLLYYFK